MACKACGEDTCVIVKHPERGYICRACYAREKRIENENKKRRRPKATRCYHQ